MSPTKIVYPAGPSARSPSLKPSIASSPVPMPRTPVQAGSELGEELLHAPALRSVPLPSDSSEPSETLVVMSDKRRKEKRMNPLFRRTGK